jgi:hypothetical protein
MMGLDAEAFASLLEVGAADVQAWEAGTRDAPSSALVRCARALALTNDELLGGELDKAALPRLFLRAMAREGKLDELLELSGDLALFVETARTIDRLRSGTGPTAPTLPEPPPDLLWGVGTPPYKADELAAWLRNYLGITTADIPSMQAIYERLGITVVWARQEEMSPVVDGASLLSPRPTVLVHLVEGPSCWWRTRMTLAHELCHLLCDFVDDRNLALVSPTPVGTRAAGRPPWQLFKNFPWIEQRASAFASHFLVPDDALRAALSDQHPVSEAAVTAVCGTFGVGRITAVSRLKHVFGLSEDLRRQMLRWPHEDRHVEKHPDSPPPRHGIREGVLLDQVAAALSEARIDRVEAHRVLGLALTEWLPEHSKLSDAERKPLRSVSDDVRGIVSVRLARIGRAALHPADVHRSDAGWRVDVVDAKGELVGEEFLSFDLDAERAKLSA